MLSRLKGIITALVTPFHDNGEVNYEELSRMIDFQIAANVNAVVFGGTTGEGMLIENIDNFYEKAINLVNKRILCGVSIFGLRKSEIINKINLYNSLNCDFYLIYTPYYLFTSKDGVIEYFKLINELVNKPFILYYNPVRTGQLISYSVWDYLLKLDKLIGIKDASKDAYTFNYLLKNKKEKLYFSGCDDAYLKDRILGSDGIVSTLSNAYPSNFVYIEENIKNGNYKNAKERYDLLYDLIKISTVEPNPICIKYILEEKGFMTNNLLFPLKRISLINQKKVKLIMEGVKDENFNSR